MGVYSLKFALLLLLLAFCIKVETVRPVVLSCDNDESLEQMEESRGLQGFPGRRGPVGISGERGFKGDKGEVGETGLIPQELTDRIDDVIRQCAVKLENLTSTLEQMQEKLATLERAMITTQRVRNCHDIAQDGKTQSGLYDVIINGTTVTVYCDLQTGNGKWLVIQRRQDGSVDFYRNWTEYESGFGNKSGEFWLAKIVYEGLRNIHALTTTRSYALRIDLEDWQGNTAYAEYSTFSVGNSSSNYTLNIGGYSGNAGGAMTSHNLNNHQFTTKDRDNDAHGSANCAEHHHGAWWHRTCTHSNLNGRYYRDGRTDYHGVGWHDWKSNWHSMKRAEMKIRPV